MKKSIKIKSERLNVIRSRRRTDNRFVERVIEDRLTSLFQAFLFAQDKRIGAVLDKIVDLEYMQMDLIKITSGLTQKLFPDYVPSVREEVSRGYHENYLN